MFFPFIVSFREITIEWNVPDITTTVFNVLFAVLMGAYFSVLVPAKPQNSNIIGAVIVIFTVLNSIIAMAIPSFTLHFSGWVNGMLNAKNLVSFVYSNLGVMLYIYMLSYFTEHEIPGVIQNA